MTTTVFLAVLLAALLHATWNSLIKGSADKFLGMSAVAFGYFPVSVIALLFVPAPLPESWPYIALSIGVHCGYMFFLVLAYRIGDLTQVYPIARGVAPMLAAVVSILFLGVRLSSLEVLALVIIIAGIMSLGLVRRADGVRNPAAFRYALATGGLIAAYSIIDGLGARVSGSPVGYFAWTAIGIAVAWLAASLIRRPDVFGTLLSDGKLVLLVGGPASFVAYGLVVWAFTLAPIALVSALRETSIIFALLIGVGFLGERLSLAKVVSTFLTLFGAALLKLAR